MSQQKVKQILTSELCRSAEVLNFGEMLHCTLTRDEIDLDQGQILFLSVAKTAVYRGEIANLLD